MSVSGAPGWAPGPRDGLRGVVAALADGVVVLDRAGRIRFANPAACRLLGRPLATLVGADFGFPVGAESVPEIELLVAGRPRVVEVRTSPGRWGGDVAVVVSLRDVTTRAVAGVEETSPHALRDPLTGLPNRSLLLDRLHQALARSARVDGTLAVMFVDLDHFKRLNDSFGHEAGDEVLRAAAQRIAAAVRPADTVCRLGGDEFVLVCDGLGGRAEAAEIAARVAAAVAAPCTVAGREVAVTASVGLAMAYDGASPESLLSDADAAMYLAKQNGRARQHLFDETLRELLSERVRLENALGRAVEDGRLRLAFQPVVALDGDVIVGAEALLRYDDPERGVLVADQFIGVAETGGLVEGLGGWALERACGEAAGWARQGWPIPVTVNMALPQLVPGLVATVERALDQAGLAPDLLCLDLSEAVVTEPTAPVVSTIAELSGLGVRLGLDDWGTGPASLTALASLPLAYVKLDRSVLAALDVDAHTVRALVAAARALELPVLAEGVESEAQLRLVRELGCTAGQGHHLGPPVPADSLVERLAAAAPPA